MENYRTRQHDPKDLSYCSCCGSKIWILIPTSKPTDNLIGTVSAWTTLLVPHSQCRHSYLLSESVFPWEQHSSEATRSCDIRDKDYRDCVQARLRRTKAALGHTPCLAIIGDSRGLAIYVNMINVTGPVILAAETMERPPSIGNQTEVHVKSIMYSPGLEPQEFCLRGRCSSNASNDNIEFQNFWRPFVDRHLSETLRTYATECGTRRRQCPDTVLVNGGLWYSGILPFMAPMEQNEQLLMFRQGLLQLASPLAELARHTRTIWKLEEAVLFEFVEDKHLPTTTKKQYMELLMLEQALIYELTLQVGLCYLCEICKTSLYTSGSTRAHNFTNRHIREIRVTRTIAGGGHTLRAQTRTVSNKMMFRMINFEAILLGTLEHTSGGLIDTFGWHCQDLAFL